MTDERSRPAGPVASDYPATVDAVGRAWHRFCVSLSSFTAVIARERTMAVTRRTFFKKAAGASVGTAVGALAGLGADLSPKVARAQELRIARAKTTTSVCCYCSVGCSLLVHTVDDQIVNIEGNPASPIN
jgi:hypothetical protein